MADQGQGERGERGDRGLQGPTGPQGIEGGGERGPRGEHGEQGVQGRPGNSTRARLALVAYVILFLTCAVTAAVVIHDRNNNLDRINDGRRVASQVVCAFGGAIAEAGRSVIISSTRKPSTPRERRFDRELERLGYPPLRERVSDAKVASQAYVSSIAQRVERATGIRDLVIDKGPLAGTLNCKKLLKVTKIN